jgi:large subunit ribosomal protein L24e
LFWQRFKPSKFDWTIVFRKLHKKGQSEDSSKKRSKKSTKVQRAIVGASLDAIKAKRDMIPSQRAQERKSQIDSIKATKKAAQAEKQKTKVPQPTTKLSKQQTKGFAPKAAAKSR